MEENKIRASSDVDPEKLRSIERVYRIWNEALGAKDVDAAVALYAPDTRLESPLGLVWREGPKRQSISSLVRPYQSWIC
jgi:ketosteroid isomerase-like protein